MINYTTVGKTILRPLKAVKVSKKIEVPDEEKNGNLKEGEVREVKLVTKKVIANFQLGTVIATSPKQEQFKVGTTVAFKPNRVIPFDLIKNTILVDDYDIVGEWSSQDDTVK